MAVLLSTLWRATSFIAFSTTLFGGCASEEEASLSARRITTDDFTSLGADGILQINLEEGAVRVDNASGQVDLDRIQLVDREGAYSASEVVARKFDRTDWNHDFLFERDHDGINTDYLLSNLQYKSTICLDPDSTWWKSPSVSCTGGRYMLGMGARADPLTHILFRGMIPHASSGVPYQNQSAYHEDLTGTPSNWCAFPIATCASAPSGLSVLSISSANNSNASKNATVTCPGGKVVLGAGGTITGGDGRVKMDAIVPLTYQVYAAASENPDTTTGNWYVTAWAICATAPGPAGLEIKHAQAPAGSLSVTPVCSSGKVILSVGGEVVATPSSNIGIGNLDFVTGATPPFGQVTFANYGAASGTVHGYVVCADP